MWEWIVGDIISTPPPDPADVEALKGQVRELSQYAAQQLVEHFRLSPQLATAAMREGEECYLTYIDEPKYRFDRKPMTEEQMEAARADIRRRIQQDAQNDPSLVGQAAPADAGAEPDRLLSRIGLLALGWVVQGYWSWRHSPDNPRFRQAREAARAAHQDLVGARELARRLGRAIDLVALAGIDPDPVAGSPAMLGPDALPRQEATIVRRLRSALRGPSLARWAGSVAFLRGVPYESKHLDAECELRPGSIRLQLRVAPDPLAGQRDRLTGSSAVCEITADEIRALSPEGPVVSTVARGEHREAPATGAHVGSPWDAARLSPDMPALAALTDPGRYEWRAVREPAEREGLQLFEARLKEAITLSQVGEIASLRYEFDPARGAVVRLTAAAPGGEAVWETVYGEFHDLPNGSAVALRATTTLGEAAAAARKRAYDARAPHLGWVGYETVTKYKWLPEAGVRVPVSRDIRDDEGHQECLIDYHDHKIDALPEG